MTRTTMTAVRLHAPGPAAFLRAETVPVPAPGAGQVLVEVAAAGVNYADTAVRRGVYPVGADLPAVLGFEAAGRVVATGDGVDEGLVGQRVVAMSPGAYAEFVTVDAAVLVPVPDDLGWPQAAAFLAQGLTAYGMLRTARLAPGETVLVHAGAGGVGSLAVQTARLLGAGTVVATAGTADKRSLAARLGAEVTVDYTSEDWPDAVRSRLAGTGGAVDVALDLVGGALTGPTVGLLRAGSGRVVLGGMSAGFPSLDAGALVTNGLTAVGYTNPVFLARPGAGPEAVGRLLGWITSGELELLVGSTYPLEEAAAAHAALENRQTVGKVVLLTRAA